jgi:hypothetical protein
MYKEHAKLLVNHHEVIKIIVSEITPKDLQFLQVGNYSKHGSFNLYSDTTDGRRVDDVQD